MYIISLYSRVQNYFSPSLIDINKVNHDYSLLGFTSDHKFLAIHHIYNWPFKADAGANNREGETNDVIR